MLCQKVGRLQTFDQLRGQAASEHGKTLREKWLNINSHSVECILKPSKPTELTASRISSFIAKIRDGQRSESIIASYLAHLRAALSWAVSVGLHPVVSKIKKPKRAKVYKKPKGRAPTQGEFKKILETVPEVVGPERADSWKYLIEGLWRSGLRLGKALELWWDHDDKLRIDRTEGRPLLRILAELEKGHQDRLLSIAPEFTEFLLRTPPEQRTGRVFQPAAERERGERLTTNQVTRNIAAIGEKAGIIVHVEARSGKKKYASAHDFRRAFGDRWALRVMPPVLMQLMRHESIETTMRYYVGRNVEATVDGVWEAYRRSTEKGQERNGKPERDTSCDSGPSPASGLEGSADATRQSA
jgi:integrase